MKNKEVANLLYTIADLLDIRGEIPFKTRAYRTAAQTIENLDEDIEILAKEGKLETLPGVGKAIAKKITEYIETGSLTFFEKLKQEIPEGIIELLEIPGLGPKKVAALYNKLGIKTVEELKKACEEGKLRGLDGFGEITERNILRGIQLKEKTQGRFLLNLAYENGSRYVEYMKQLPYINKISIAGSLRRMKETIGDIDILVSSDKPEEVMNHFVAYPEVKQVLLKGRTKTSVILEDGIQVDLRVVEEKSFGAALQYFTGSKDHNIALRGIAIKKGYKLSEYGLFEKDTDRYVTGETEEEVYRTLGLSYIPPELRENRGEIEASLNNSLPNLVTYEDIKGDLHVHSKWSDGLNTIEEIAIKAKELGYEYIGIADHSQSLKIAKGLSEERILSKIEEIKKLNGEIEGIHILCGTECDIKQDGTLDYPNAILKKFDFVVAGIHMGFKMTREEATKRITTAMDNEYVNIIAHPTCRLIGRREPFDLDMDEIFEKAVETNTYLEINAFPDRLDLNDIYCKRGKEMGVKFVINTDAHSITHLPYMQYGVATARRGWLEKKDILNTLPINDLKKVIRC
ncbi:MAG TPA: DNA polymerase/3'-5' exonuclease PolX [Thermoplasmatales archaeon]|nr:DNA polymerase/3'-5' exonuclease PolX [Thermoplasmatales archaeon]